MRTCHTCYRLFVVLVVALLALSATGCQFAGELAAATPVGAPPAPSPTAAAAIAGSTVAPALQAGQTKDRSVAIRQVATQVKPAVVQITSQQVQVDLFNRPFEVPAGVGSGVIYDRDGHILTNNHVVEGAQKLLLGVGYVALTPAIAAQLRIVEKTGVLVRQVVAESPADRAGLQRGDVITEMDSKALKGDSALAQAISAHKPGDTVTLTVWRAGQKSAVQVTLGEMPAP